MPPAERSSSQDACPGALAVHRAEDGNLARVRIPGGILRATQLAAITDAAIRLGDGHLELTSRGNIQLRALAPGAEVELAGLLRHIGLLPSESHERVRNIAASPLTGRDGSGRFDVRPLTADLDRGLCADPDLAELSGRFLFAVDDGRRDVSGLDTDVTLLAVSPAVVALILAGQDTGLRTGSADAAALALAAARAFLTHSDPRSPAWRMAELSPETRDRVILSLTSSPGVWLAEQLASAPATPPEVGLLAQRDGLVAVCVAVALGRLDPHQLDVLIQAAAEAGTAGEVVITPWRTVLVPDLPASTARRWQASFGAAGLLTDPASPLVRVSACAGKPRCGRALADVRADALSTFSPATDAPVDAVADVAVDAVADVAADGVADVAVDAVADVAADGVADVALVTAAAGSLAVHWIGCERACGRPAGRHVQVLAVDDGYQVSLDGEVRAQVAAGGDLAHAVTTVRGEPGLG